MEYPLNLSFDNRSLAPQISVTDAHGKLVLCAKQRHLRLKRSITVFADAEQAQPLYGIKADSLSSSSAGTAFSTRMARTWAL
jgi:hypothetical protein